MQLPRDAILLRIFFGEEDRANRLPLYKAIVLKAREMHLAGATVLRGGLGYPAAYYEDPAPRRGPSAGR